jgi:hypothetical protein
MIYKYFDQNGHWKSENHSSTTSLSVAMSHMCYLRCDILRICIASH